VTHLIFEITDPLKKILIQFNGHDTIFINNENNESYVANDCYILNNIEHYENYYIIPFSKSLNSGINFSRIDNIQINIWNYNKSIGKEFNVYGLHLQGCRLGQGFFDISFKC